MALSSAQAANDQPSTLATSPIVLLVMAGQHAAERVRSALSRHELKPRQLQILELLAHEDAVGQRELGDRLATDHSILVTMLNPLEEAGLIERRRSCTDRRRHVVSLTAAGRRRHAEAVAHILAVEQELLGELSAADRSRLAELLQVLAADVTPENGDEC
jgi:DNA-binding MarR family transcriptional regulator